MMRQRQVLTSLLLAGAVVFVLGLGALAQSVSLTVTAYSDAIRFSAQGSVKELRVEILSLSGQKVFDSGPVLGNALDWKLLNSQGQPVANGVYLYTVTVKDPSGNVTKKLGKLAVLRGKGVAAPPLSGISVGRLVQPQTEPCPPTCDYTGTTPFTINVGGQVMRITGDSLRTTNFDLTLLATRTDGASYGSVRFTITGTTPGIGLFAHGQDSPAGGAYIAAGWRATWGQRRYILLGQDGTVSRIVSDDQASATEPDIVFAFGDFFAGATTERMRLTSTGNLGIGTIPSAKTHISNTANQPALRIDSSDGTNALEIYNTGSGSATGLIFRVERATGNVYADGSFTGGGADVAERIDVSEAVEPGDVVEIDPENPGKFRKAREAISTRVAGVISTAPGVVLGNKSAESNDARPILALAGRVPVKVTAKYGAIAVGDLLVSSPIPGYAMKCPEKSQCIGAVIGKALEPLAEGSGLIEVQVVLR
jgi:hypothetical protein